MYYAFVGERFQTVLNSWLKAEEEIVKDPFALYKSFATQEEAYKFVSNTVNRYKKKSTVGYVNYSYAVLCEYFLKDSNIFYNIKTPSVYTTRIPSGVLTVDTMLNPNSLKSNILAVERIMDLFAKEIPLIFKVDNLSLYYLSVIYKGRDSTLIKFKENVREREVAWQVRQN